MSIISQPNWKLPMMWLGSIDQRKLLFRTLAFLILLNFGWNYAKERVGVDFYNYWLASKIVKEVGSDKLYDVPSHSALVPQYYSEAEEEGGRRLEAARFWQMRIGTSSSPFFYSVIESLWSGDYETDYRRLQLVLLLSFFIGVMSLSIVVGCNPGIVELGIAAAMTQFQPYLLDIKVCNVNRLLFGWLAFYLFIRQGPSHYLKQILASFVLVSAFLFKPILLFGIMLLAWCRLINPKWPQLGLEILGGIIAVVVALSLTVVNFGSVGIWITWIKYAGLVLKITPTNLGNWGLVPLVREIWHIDLSHYATPFFLLFSAFVLGLRVRTFGRESGAREDILPLSFGVLTYVLCANLCWSHYFTLTLIPLIYLLREDPEQGSAWNSFRCWFGLLSGVLLSAKPVDDFLQFGLREAWGIYMCSGSLILYFLLVADALHHLWLTRERKVA